MRTQTDRTIRQAGQWVKISRNANAHQFIFARGEAGDPQAKEVQSFPFEFIATWADAEDHAKSRMAAYP